jgi:hypothetical protein
MNQTPRRISQRCINSSMFRCCDEDWQIGQSSEAISRGFQLSRPICTTSPFELQPELYCESNTLTESDDDDVIVEQKRAVIVLVDDKLRDRV